MAVGTRELREEEDYRRLLADAHEQLVQRDAELARLRDALIALERRYRELAANFEQVQGTRAWRAVLVYRRLRARLRGR